jgi:hypothetical protein
MMLARPLRALVLATSAIALTACASTGATFRSGVGDSFPEHPPYYAGVTMEAVADAPLAYTPIVFQRGASQSEIFDPTADASSPVSRLLVEMNAFADSLLSGATRATRSMSWAGTPPNVIFGCITDTGTPEGDCAEQGDAALAGGDPRMRLAVGRGSQSWIDSARSIIASREGSRLVVLTLEVGQYLPRQRGIVGRKEVELGSGHTVQLPWLTSTTTPVSVLQLTGAVVGADGLAMRIGAEGIFARRTPLIVSAVGAQSTLSDSDVEEVRTRVRDDLPGRPLAWKVALAELLSRLTGRTLAR